MNILVTGGMGFIGSNFIRFMLKNRTNCKIVNLDKLTYAGNPENLADLSLHENYSFVQGDICDYETVNEIVSNENINTIINFAAESHVDRSISNPNVFVKTNINGTLTLLNAAREKKLEKFIQISTDEVYGSLNFGDPTFKETTPLDPSSPYSSSKAGADLLCLSYQKTYELNVCITRCSNNYGPYQFPEKFIPLLINNIRNNKDLPIYGDGKNIRDWIYVEDHCSGILRVLEQGKSGEIYNFGGNCELSNIDLVNILLEKMKGSKNLIKYVKDRPGHDLRYGMNITKSKTELNWQPVYTFEEGIDKTIDWYDSHSKWLDDIISGDYKSYYINHYGDK
jgi:dTDP-glucose 4,6-dehydratase